MSLEFFSDITVPGAAWPWDRQVSKRNENQEYFLWGRGGRFAGLTNLLPSCADCLEIWNPQTPGNPRACLIFINTFMYKPTLKYINTLAEAPHCAMRTHTAHLTPFNCVCSY